MKDILTCCQEGAICTVDSIDLLSAWISLSLTSFVWLFNRSLFIWGRSLSQGGVDTKLRILFQNNNKQREVLTFMFSWSDPCNPTEDRQPEYFTRHYRKLFQYPKNFNLTLAQSQQCTCSVSYMPHLSPDTTAQSVTAFMAVGMLKVHSITSRVISIMCPWLKPKLTCVPQLLPNVFLGHSTFRTGLFPRFATLFMSNNSHLRVFDQGGFCVAAVVDHRK